MENVAVYLGDIIKTVKTIEEHLKIKKEVFNRLYCKELKVKPEKCIFLRVSEEYCGHKISGKGIGM